MKHELAKQLKDAGFNFKPVPAGFNAYGVATNSFIFEAVIPNVYNNDGQQNFGLLQIKCI